MSENPFPLAAIAETSPGPLELLGQLEEEFRREAALAGPELEAASPREALRSGGDHEFLKIDATQSARLFL